MHQSDVNLNLPPTRDILGFSGAFSPYWQLFESQYVVEVARLALRNVGH